MSFYTKIKPQVSELTNKFEYPNDGTSFGHFALKECFSKIIDYGYDGTDLDSYIKNHIVDMANDLGNDAIFVNQKNREISIFQFKYSKQKLLTTNEVKKNKKFIDWILKINSENLTPNSKLKKIIDEEISIVLTPENIEKNNYSVIFYYIDNSFDEMMKTDIKALKNNYRDRGINFIDKFYNHEELEQLYDDIEIPKNEVTLKLVPDKYFTYSTVYHDTVDTPIEILVGMITANSLKSIIEEKKELILALNVRYYKGETDINSKIKNELSKGDKGNFAILNNGVKAVCKDYKIIDGFVKILDFQIVNGGQTAKTLANIVNDLSENVEISFTLNKIEDRVRTSKISKDIAIASNSQNPITSRDLHSGDKIQNEIFMALDKVDIFYDKRDGEWATVTNKKKYKNPLGKTPQHLKISNIDLGIDFLSFFLQVPISTAGRNKLVFSDTYYDQIFNTSTNVDDQISKLLLSHRISERINVIKSEKIENYEILQNNYIKDVIVALSAIYFFKDNLKTISTIKDLKEKLKEFNGQPYLNLLEKYNLEINNDFNKFILIIIGAIQYKLDIKKGGKKEYEKKDWMPTDTDKWLKKDGTYQEIYGGVIEKIRTNLD